MHPIVIENDVRNGKIGVKWRFYCDECRLVGSWKSESDATAESRRHNEVHHSSASARTELDEAQMWAGPL